jgi:hypothetical protein
MGLRFRKSIKLAPCVKLNLGKKSAGISVGGKYGGVSYNTRTGTRARVSAPGTGLSYSTKIDSNKSKVTKHTASSDNNDSGNNHNNGSNNNNGSCLISCLKIFGVLILLVLLGKLGWIAGIIWFIFFRKKLNNDTQKQKKYTIIIAILSVLSFFIMLGSGNSSPEDDNIPINTESSINTETDSESAFATEQDSTDESTTESEIVSEPNTETIPESEQTSESEIVSEVAPNTEANQTPSQSNQSVMVWVDDTAKRYHRKNGCGMNNAYQVTLEEAEAMGKTPCGRCYK